MKKIIGIFSLLIIIGILIFLGIKYYNTNNEDFLGYNITKVTETEEIKNNEGITLVNVKYSYPVIENKENSDFITNKNNEYKSYIETFLNEAEESKKDAQSLYEFQKDEFMPYTRELDYEVNMNKNGLLSITNNEYYYSGGAHGSYIMQSRTFDINAKRELTLDNVINNDVWNIKENIRKLFREKLQNDGLDLTEIWGEILEEELENINFYLKEGTLVLYFNAEQVAPYVLGAPTVEIPYDKNIFLVDISSDSIEDIDSLKIVTLSKSLTPTGFAGSSLNKIELYSNGDVYWVQYDGEGFSDENIVKNMLIATNATDIEMFEEEGINIIGNDVILLEELNLGWLNVNN